MCRSVQDRVPINCNYTKHREDETAAVLGDSARFTGLYRPSWAKCRLELFVFSCQAKTLQRHFHPLQSKSFPLLHSLGGVHDLHVICYTGCFKKEPYHGIPNVTAWRVLRNRLHLKTYRLSIGQHMTATSAAKFHEHLST
jgi:hypothetical protein